MFPEFSRRRFLQTCSTGFGSVALAGLMSAPGLGKGMTLPTRGNDDRLPSTAALKELDHPAKAKHVIFCFMSGGVSHVDSFDPKPALTQLHGQPMPGKIQRTQFNQNGNIMRNPLSPHL